MSEYQTDSTMLHFAVIETNNAFRVITQTYFNSDHMIDFCVQISLHGVVRNQDCLGGKVSQVYEASMSTKWVHNKQTTDHFVFRNE